MTGRRPLRGAVLAALLVATAAVTLAPVSPAEAMPIPVTVRVVIGHSVQGREIVAYHRYYAGAVSRLTGSM